MWTSGVQGSVVPSRKLEEGGLIPFTRARLAQLHGLQLVWKQIIFFVLPLEDPCPPGRESHFLTGGQSQLQPLYLGCVPEKPLDYVSRRRRFSDNV